MKPGRILLADNLEDHLTATGEFLELEGYEIIQARTIEEAENVLKSRWVHLAILDIRMVDDDDHDDVSGLLLAKNPEYSSTPKIIYTGYPTYEAVREALSPRVGEMPAAVAYISKHEGPLKLLEAVRQAFRSIAQINFNLVIRWLPESPLSFRQILAWIEPVLETMKLAERVDELEDLLRRAFHEHDHINISSLVWVQNERLCLEAFAGKGGDESHWLLTCGKSPEIRQDFLSEQRSAPNSYPFAGLVRIEETIHYALIARDISKYGLAKVRTLDKALGEMSENQTRVVIENLYLTQLAGWCQPRPRADQTLVSASLAESYRQRLGITHLPEMFSLHRTIQRLARQKSARDLLDNLELAGSGLSIRFKNGETLLLPNPLVRLYTDSAFPEMEATLGLTTKSLNAHNVVFVRPAVALPTDCSGLADGPILSDYLSLEEDIRFRWMGVSNLLTLLDFEQQLLETTSLSDTIKTKQVEPECGKALAAILAIRNAAVQETKSALAPYLLGLYYFSMRGILELDPDASLIQDEIAVALHRLLLAGLLCQFLDQLASAGVGFGSDQPAAELPALELVTERRAVRLGSRMISLTPTEYELLSYLYKYQGQICQREDILREVFKVSRAVTRADKGLLNTNIGRLREKIENKPNQPVYLLTAQRQGYRLVIKPE